MIAITMIAVIALIIAGCETAPGTGPTTTIIPSEFDPSKPATAKSFNSEAELQAFLNSLGRTDSLGYDMVATTDRMVADAAMETADSAPAPSVAADRDFSETNIQVEGIDEGDILKTDGEYIYTITGNTLFIIKAYPGEEAEIVSRMKFEDTPEGLYVGGNNLVVYGRATNLDFLREHNIRASQGMSFLRIYDVSDKENPSVDEEYFFEGRPFETRMKDGYVYFSTVSQPMHRPGFPTPILLRGGVVESIPVSNVYYYDAPYESANFVNIHAVNMDTGRTNSASITVDRAETLYMSHDNAYITHTQRINEWEIQQRIAIQVLESKATPADRELIRKIRAVDPMVMDAREKDQRILGVLQSYYEYLDRDEREAIEDEIELKVKEELEKYEYREYTIISRISIDRDRIRLESTGQVPGRIINQFSLDEHDDVLRIGTTISPTWSRFDRERTESTNNVFTLDMNLNVLDHAGNIAPGESIYSTRFVGDTLYMVTFREVDPFFVVDLSNPRNIEILGELKITGYSRYLHPYDENTVIGVGRETTETGRMLGMKVSLFDVSDFENPREIAKYVTDERFAQTSAEFEHKAFLFSKEKELLVLPVHSPDYRQGEQSYNGAMVFRITSDEIELRGLVDHSDAVPRETHEREVAEPGMVVDRAMPMPWFYGPLVERSLYIEELLYTKSPNLLRINHLDDLSTVKNIALEEERETGIPIY